MISLQVLDLRRRDGTDHGKRHFDLFSLLYQWVVIFSSSVIRTLSGIQVPGYRPLVPLDLAQIACLRGPGEALGSPDRLGRFNPVQHRSVISKYRVYWPLPAVHNVGGPTEDHLQTQLTEPALDSGYGQCLRRQHVCRAEIEGR